MLDITTTSAPPATVVAVIAAAVAAVAIGAYGVRLARTTSDFLVASRSVGPQWNAAAISGEYLSAASFLGVAGLIAKYGADALWYPIGFTAGYVGLLLFVAAPLRRSGAYTVPDFAEFRLGSVGLRRLATAMVVVICVLYLVPQLQGAGLTLNILLGLPPWVGAVVVGGVVIANVVGGGMRSVTFVQAFQYWLKLTAIAVPAVVLGLHLYLGDRPPATDTPATVATDTRLQVNTDVTLRVSTPLSVQIDGRVDGRPVNGPIRLAPGEHRVDAESRVLLPAGATVPQVAGAPSSYAQWARPGWGFGGEHPMYQVYSLIIGIFLGTMGLPHVLVRFYTNPDGRAARATSMAVVALLGVFYLFPTVLGAVTRLWVPQLLLTGTSDAVVLLLPGGVLAGIWGQLLAALVAAGAVAAFLATASGLLVSVAGVVSTDVLRGRVRDFRIASVLTGLVPIALAVAVSSIDLSRTVGLAFTVAASTLCPLLVLGIWWRGLTAVGAAAGLVVGAVTAGSAVVVTAASGLLDDVLHGWPEVLLSYPAAISVPLAFATMVAVSMLTAGRVPADVGRILTRLHAPERLGVGRDRETTL